MADDIEKWFGTLNYDERARKRLPAEKNEKVISLMKGERGNQIVTKFTTAAPKTFGYRVQRDDHEIEGSGFIMAKLVKKSTSKEVTLHDFSKCVDNTINTPITKEQMSFRSHDHKIYIVTCNKIGMLNPNENGKKNSR